jgi:hypothetical protein
MAIDDLSERLADLAEECAPPIDAAAGAVQRARQLRRRSLFFAGTSVLVAFAAVAGGALAVTGNGSSEPSAAKTATTGYLPWPARGDLADDEVARAKAIKAWDKTGGPHRDVRVVYGTKQAGGARPGSLPTVFLLEGIARDGQLRVAWLTTPDSGADQSSGLTVRADRPAPDPSSTQDVGLVIQTDVSGVQQWTALDVAAPGSTVMVPSPAELYYGEKPPVPAAEFIEGTVASHITDLLVIREGKVVLTHEISA